MRLDLVSYLIIRYLCSIRPRMSSSGFIIISGIDSGGLKIYVHQYMCPQVWAQKKKKKKRALFFRVLFYFKMSTSKARILFGRITRGKLSHWLYCYTQ